MSEDKLRQTNYVKEIKLEKLIEELRKLKNKLLKEITKGNLKSFRDRIVEIESSRGGNSKKETYHTRIFHIKKYFIQDDKKKIFPWRLRRDMSLTEIRMRNFI